MNPPIICYWFVHLHGRLITWLKTIYKLSLRWTERSLYVVFNSRRFYNVPRELIEDARSCQVRSGYGCHLGLTDTLSRSHANIDLISDNCCEFHKYEVMTMSVVGAQPKTHTNLSYISNGPHFLWVYRHNKPWVFNQSERAYCLSYFIKSNKTNRTHFSNLWQEPMSWNMQLLEWGQSHLKFSKI